MADKLTVAVATYITKGIQSGNAKKTLREKRLFFKRFIADCGHLPFNEKTVQGHLQAMRDRNLKPSTIALAVRVLRPFVTHYAEKYSVEDFRLKLIKPKINRKPYHLYSVDISEKIIMSGTEPGPGDNSRNRRIKLKEYRPALLFALRTGLRSIELQRMRGEDINAYETEPNFYVHSKGGDTDRLPIPENTLECLRDRVNRDRIFEITSTQLNIVLARGCKNLGIRKITCHDLRHTFATDMLQNGASMQLVSRWLRHKSVLITDKIYSHFNIKDLAKSVALHHTSQRRNLSDKKRVKYIWEALVKLGIDENGLSVTIKNGKLAVAGKIFQDRENAVDPPLLER